MNEGNEKSDHNEEKEEKDDDIFQQVVFAAALVGEYAVNHLCKEPCRTSELPCHA
jgi:hypothetical protein